MNNSFASQASALRSPNQKKTSPQLGLHVLQEALVLDCIDAMLQQGMPVNEDIVAMQVQQSRPQLIMLATQLSQFGYVTSTNLDMASDQELMALGLPIQILRHIRVVLARRKAGLSLVQNPFQAFNQRACQTQRNSNTNSFSAFANVQAKFKSQEMSRKRPLMSSNGPEPSAFQRWASTQAQNRGLDPTHYGGHIDAVDPTASPSSASTTSLPSVSSSSSPLPPLNKMRRLKKLDSSSSSGSIATVAAMSSDNLLAQIRESAFERSANANTKFQFLSPKQHIKQTSAQENNNGNSGSQQQNTKEFLPLNLDQRTGNGKHSAADALAALASAALILQRCC